MDEEECACDALFPTVLAQGQEERRKFRSLARDPEENWMDGFMAGWFAGHFTMPPVGITLPQEEEKVCTENELISS